MIRTVATYVLLVGVPLLGLLGILHLGEGIKAPASVGGNWAIEAGPPVAGAPACASPLDGVQKPAMMISQSGPRLVVQLNDTRLTTLTGTLDGPKLAIGEPQPGAPAAGTNGSPCGSGAPGLIVQATLERANGRDQLVGEMSASGSGTCAPTTFRATRVPPAGSGA